MTKSLKLETTTKTSKMLKKRKNKNKRMTRITTRKPIWMTTIKTPITKRTNMMNKRITKITSQKKRELMVQNMLIFNSRIHNWMSSKLRVDRPTSKRKCNLQIGMARRIKTKRMLSKWPTNATRTISSKSKKSPL